MRIAHPLAAFSCLVTVLPGEPRAQTLAELVPSGIEEEAGFGYSVASDEKYILVGAPFADEGEELSKGKVYVFRKAQSGWASQGVLTAPDGGERDFFGSSIALQGSTALIGAYGDGLTVGSNRGAAYVFNRAGETWTFSEKLEASDGGAGDYFGYSLDLSQTTAIVGARNAMVNGVAKGAVYVYELEAGSWVEREKLHDPSGDSNDLFAHSVAIDEDVILAGARGAAVADNLYPQGKTVVFRRVDSEWSVESELIASDGVAGTQPGAPGDRFGEVVVLNGPTAIVSAPLHDLGDSNDRGAVYVYRRSGDSWAELAKLADEGGAAGDQLGTSLSAFDKSVLVGARYLSNGVEGRPGGALLFTEGLGAWSKRATYRNSTGLEGDAFGFSVALSGAAAVIGAVNADVELTVDAGRAFLTDPWTLISDGFEG